MSPSARRMAPRATSNARRIGGWATALALMITGLAIATPTQAHADTVNAVAKVVDPPTFHQFPGSSDTSYFEASRYPGRIWTDKTVFGDPNARGINEDKASPTLTLGPNELAVVLSALGSTRHVTGESETPIDLVLVLDNSRSMVQCVVASATSDGYCDDPANWQGSRAYAMTQAVNTALTIIAGDNPDNRVALVQFGTGVGTLSTLGAPQMIGTTADYVTLSAPTANNGNMTFRTATNSMTIGTVGSTFQSTNLQLGIATGMSVLANQPTASVSGTNQRIPNVLVFTDGEPTLSATTANWWNLPANAGTQGPSIPGNPQYYGNGFKAALTASFLKDKISDVYNNETFNQQRGFSDVKTHVYTVGLGLDALSSDGKNLALVTLDPANQLGKSSDTMNTGFTNAWKTYSGGASVSVPVAQYQSFTVSHPTAAADKIYDPATKSTGIAYNDAYYAPITTEDLVEAFRAIAQQIVDASPNYPVDVEDGVSSSASGYVTFFDPLGPFMRVADVDRLAFCSIIVGVGDPNTCVAKTFVNPTVTDLGGGVKKYTFTGSYTANDVAGSTDVSGVIITVRSFDSLARGDEVTVQIPAALLPMRDSRITMDSNGDPVGMKQYVSHPLHVYYTVSPKDGVIDALANPAQLNTASSGDGTALAQYIAQHTVDSMVRFYSDNYTVGTDGTAQADTHVSWQSDVANDYYRFSFDSPLYADSGLATQLTAAAWAALSDNDPVWYYVIEYAFTDDTYTTVETQHTVEKTTKGQLLAAVPYSGGANVVNDNGVMIAKSGLLDFARPGLLDHPKCLNLTWISGNPECLDPSAEPAQGNLTNTADMARQVNYASATVTTALGNNGYLAYDLPVSLTVRKVVHAAGGLNPDPAQTFNVAVALSDSQGQPLTGSYAYSIYDVTDTTTPIGSGTVGSGGTIPLKANQQASIIGLPEGASYTVTEPGPLPSGYTLTSTTQTTGTIAAGTSALAILENTYAPASVAIHGTPVATKTLDGRDWLSTDSFSASLCPIGSPKSACESSTFIQDDQHSGTATFTDHVFTAPGTYVYTIHEDDSNPLPALSYSGAIYQWTVVVTDDGTGQLKAVETMVKSADDSAAILSTPEPATEAAFTNTYDEHVITAQLTATKMVHDHSTGLTRTPDGTYDFGFQYLGADLDDPSATPPASEPSFSSDSDGDGIVSVKNVGTLVSSPSIQYDSAQIGHDFYFKAWEEVGTIHGVTYTDTVWYWRVSVSLSADGNPQLEATQCSTSASAAPGRCDPVTGAANYSVVADTDRVFLNEYAPAPVTVDLTGSKTLDGRPWVGTDSYSFTLAPNDQVTTDAITAGDVIMPTSTTASVGPGLSGSGPASFSFGDITFTRQGSYQFSVTETVGTNQSPGVTYDTHTAIYDVVISSPTLQGQLAATVTVRGNDSGNVAASFVNRYHATQLFGGVDVIKTLTGRALKVGEFSFTVTALDQASCDKALFLTLPPIGSCALTATNGTDAAHPSWAYLPGEFNFTQGDLGHVFSYSIAEDDTGLGGVTYDPTVYFVTLEPMYDEATGAIYVITTFRIGGVNGPIDSVHDSRTGTRPQVGFTNGYTPAPVNAEPRFSKDIVGRGWADTDAFSFQIAPITTGAPMPATTEVSVSSAAQAADFGFGTITYTAAGIYQYAVSEVIPPTPVGGLEYDSVAAVVTVTVTDDQKGALHAQVDYDGNEAFVNYYQSSLDWQLVVKKTLTGRGMTTGEFGFSLVPDDQSSADLIGVPLTGMTWTNQTDQPDGATETMARLDGPARLTQEDSGETYCYTVAETVPSDPEPGMTYDRTTYHFCVAVTDDGLGVLTAQTTVDGSDGSHVVFTNVSSDSPERVTPFLEFKNAFTAPNNPEEPNDPDEPGVPDEPTTPDVPTTPDTPTSVIVGGAVAHTPVTGLMGIALIALGCLFMGIRRSQA